MADHGFTAKSFDFLDGLADNNDRDWFNAHRDTFRSHVEGPFLDLVADLTDRMADCDVPLRGGPRTMFRMNRDVRFAKDKSPYKTSVSAVLTPSGTKSEAGGLLYVQMDRTGGFAATGWHQLDATALGPFRDAMVSDADGFAAVRDGLSRTGRALSGENSLTTMPRGYAEHDDHRHADAIRLKSLIVAEDLPKVAFTSGDAGGRVADLVRDAMPFLAWGRHAAGMG